MAEESSKNKKPTDNGYKVSCNEVRCGAQGQFKFCIPVVFQQQLILPLGGLSLVPLSTVSQNLDNIYGSLKIKFNANSSRMAYRLYVYGATNNLNQITSATLNTGSANENGPVVATFYTGAPRQSNGLFVKGLVGNSDIQAVSSIDGYAFNSIASVYEAIRRGLIYVTVQSQQFPGGVIRGQIFGDN